MTYIENIFLCLALPMLLSLLFTSGSPRRFTLFVVLGMATCLLSAYVSSFFMGRHQCSAVTTAIEIAPVCEEILKLLPLLLYFLIFEPDSRVNTVAEVVSVSSGSEGKSEMVVRMKSAAALKVKEVLTPECTSGSFHMRLNGIELAPGPDLGNKELMRFEKGDVFKMDSRWDSRFDDPSGLISTIMILELEGKARQTLLFVHSVLQPAGGNFINMWKYLNQRGVF